MGSKIGRAAGARAIGSVGAATEALHLEVVKAPLAGERALRGHVLGMRLLIPAEGVHGPRETPALLYLFGDGLGIRPSDDAPMSAVPLYGLHIVMPHVAVARWVYKAGRTAHANVDLARQQSDFVASLASWTIDDFQEADDKLQVLKTTELAGPVHLYQHLGLVRLVLPRPNQPPLRLKSALPESAATYVRMWEVFRDVKWPAGLTMDKPSDDPAALAEG